MTEKEAGESLYRKEPKIYPRQVTGRFARLRVVAGLLLLASCWPAASVAGSKPSAAVDPAFGETLSEERRKLLAAYVQSLSDS